MESGGRRAEILQVLSPEGAGYRQWESYASSGPRSRCSPSGPIIPTNVRRFLPSHHHVLPSQRPLRVRGQRIEPCLAPLPHWPPHAPPSSNTIKLQPHTVKSNLDMSKNTAKPIEEPEYVNDGEEEEESDEYEDIEVRTHPSHPGPTVLRPRRMP